MAGMSKTRAMAQARDEIRFYREGPRNERQSWVVNTYDPDFDADRISHRMDYFAARAVAAEARLSRTYELMGMDTLDASDRAHHEMQDYGVPR